MKRSLISRLGLKTPSDGLTTEEKELERLIAEEAIGILYAKLPTARMKAIVALYFELGYPQETVAQIFQISQPRISIEIDNIQKVLKGEQFRPVPRKYKIKELGFYSLQIRTNIEK